MPRKAAKAPAKAPAKSPTKKSTRNRTESSRKRGSRENDEAEQRKCADKKAAAEARKELRAEAQADNLLVEREGESPQLTQLRNVNLELETENHRMKAKLKRRHKNKSKTKSNRRIVPAPENKGDITIKLVRKALGVWGKQYAIVWSVMRGDMRGLLLAAGLDWETTWSKQDIDKINRIFHAFENRHEGMKDLDRHWGTDYLAKECFDNMYTYNRTREKGKDTPRAKRTHSTIDGSSPSGGSDDQPYDAVAHQAAAHRSYARKRARLEAEAQGDNDGTAPSKGDTEPEDLPEDVRRRVEREEIGVPSSSKLSTNAARKAGLGGGLGSDGSDSNGSDSDGSDSDGSDSDRISDSSGQTSSDDESDGDD